MNKTQELQRIIRRFRDEHGRTDVEMREVVIWAARELGYQLPEPRSAIDRAVDQFSRAARQETRVDRVTGRPYRANHVYKVPKEEEGGQLSFTSIWVDIDEAPRAPMYASAQMRREQIVHDAVQLTFDMEHWNRINPHEEPIIIELDFRPDVEWARHAPTDRDEEAG